MPVPKEDEVLLKVMAVGVCGSDIPRINKKGAHVSPIIPGHEFAGEIVELGSKVTGWKVSDRVAVAPLIPCFECSGARKASTRYAMITSIMVREMTGLLPNIWP